MPLITSFIHKVSCIGRSAVSDAETYIGFIAKGIYLNAALHIYLSFPHGLEIIRSQQRHKRHKKSRNQDF